MKVLIHAVPKRLWYVDGFLVPSLIEQGITPVIYCDNKGLGNLGAFLDSCRNIRGDGTWHIQDDVIISSRFAELAEANDTGVCKGFCHEPWEDDPHNTGEVYMPDLWHSFQCVRIPDDMARDFVKWVEHGKHDSWVDLLIRRGQNDDYIFGQYLQTFHGAETARNIKPNMVDHVDWLIGGSTLSEWRGYFARSDLWEEENLVADLKQKLKSMNLPPL